jgi:hypothetical protein
MTVAAPFALAARLVLTTTSGAGRLSGPAIGLALWTSHTMQRPDGGDLTVTAVPAVHSPEDGERDAGASSNCEVIGFVLSGANLPIVYLSGDQQGAEFVAVQRDRVGLVVHPRPADVRSG